MTQNTNSKNSNGWLMKRSTADIWFSKCIRARDKYTCQRCFRVYPPDSTALHCSHHFSRRHRTVRFDCLNAISLCFSCHQWFGGNPYEAAIWLEDEVGIEILEIIREKKDMKIKVPKSEEKLIAKHYREQHKLLLADEWHKLVSYQ